MGALFQDSLVRHRSQKKSSDTDTDVRRKMSDVRRRGQNKMSEEEIRSQQWSLILCGVVTVNFRVLSLFVVATCCSYSKTESVVINFSSAWWRSNKSTHRAEPAFEVTTTRDNTITYKNRPFTWKKWVASRWQGFRQVIWLLVFIEPVRSLLYKMTDAALCIRRKMTGKAAS
jgi:hypothetical protein